MTLGLEETYPLTHSAPNCTVLRVPGALEIALKSLRSHGVRTEVSSWAGGYASCLTWLGETVLASSLQDSLSQIVLWVSTNSLIQSEWEAQESLYTASGFLPGLLQIPNSTCSNPLVKVGLYLQRICLHPSLPLDDLQWMQYAFYVIGVTPYFRELQEQTLVYVQTFLKKYFQSLVGWNH